MKRTLLTCLAITVLICANAQSADTALVNYLKTHTQEKAWIHYDKASYFPGETIWFKAYLMEGMYPADESRNFYVDWIADNGNVLQHSVSPVVSAATNGQFEIPAGYSGSTIHVRAYTKWMLNFDTAFVYSKDIRILNLKPQASKGPGPKPQPVLDLFPEGGDLIAGISNTIAFKAADQWGRPVKVKGVIMDDKGKVLDSLKTMHDGMGKFVLTPAFRVQYKVKWFDEYGTAHNNTFSASRNRGVAMQVLPDGLNRVVRLYSTDSLPEQLKELHLLGIIDQKLAFRTDISMNNEGTAKRIIPCNDLTTGILTLTLFDAGWNPISERICFINNHDYSFQPEMEVQHWGLGRRKRNEVQLTIPDSLQGANLSVSVTDVAIDKDTADNIISHFLLTSEIRGRVNNASWYFSGISDEKDRALDLVMMTHGWRRFKWEDVVKTKQAPLPYTRDSTYLALSGKVFGVPKGTLSGKESIVLLVKERDSASKFMILPIQTNGNFGDPQIVLFDTVKVYYSLKSKFFSQAEARFMTDRLPAPNYQTFSKNFSAPSPYYDTTGAYLHGLLAEETQRLKDMQMGKVMDVVTIRTKQKSPIQQLDDKYASGLFQGGDGTSFDLVNDPSSFAYMDIFGYLQGKVAGLQINTAGGTASLSWRGGTPQLYLDETPTEADNISMIPVSDIAYVKVFRPPFMGGSGGGANGAIAIYTRKGNDAQNTPGRGGLHANLVEGYTPIKQFYSPNYDRFDPRNDQPDVRTTLYWNPLMLTSQGKNKLNLVFYNNDVTKSFRVVVEGVSREGLLTHFEQVME